MRLPARDEVTDDTPVDCVIAIANGEVIGIGDISHAAVFFAENTATTEVVRVPVAVGQHFFMEPWPGRDAALAILAQEADRAP